MSLLYFIKDALLAMLKGGPLYWIWNLILLGLTSVGVVYYVDQLENGLVVTGMSDQVSWGFYIANFAFLVGVAASSVLLVIPAYIFHRSSAKKVVLLGEGLAVSAVIMSMLFVVVDLGRPERMWHMFPVLGRFNFPISILAWDVVVLAGYLVLNFAIPFYIQYCHYRDKEPKLWLYFPFVILAIFWAISIHTVTAFLFSANTGRPFWHTALVGPRFIASAFVSGPAVIILVMQIIRSFAKYPISQEVIRMTALIMAVALQISLFFVGAEIFTDFYNETSHAASIHYLFLGLHGFNSLTTWIWTALILNSLAFIILTIHPLRENILALNLACIFTIIGVWIEKGMGFVVPGFIPTPLGEIYEYTPTLTEYWISISIWAIGILAFTLMAKASIAIESGEIRYSKSKPK
jgi:molybdopterin-containing oxidoreductase family membrane subunit